MGQSTPAYNPRAIHPAPLFLGKIEVSAMEKFQARARTRPAVPWVSSTESAVRSDQTFCEITQNPGITLNPVALGFIPVYFWPNKEVSFADLVYDFFRHEANKEVANKEVADLFRHEVR
jgi:hypothetical protein